MTEKTARVFLPVPVTGPTRLWFAIMLAALGLPLLWLLFTLLRSPLISYRIGGGQLAISSSLGSSHLERTLGLARINQVHPEWLRGGSLRFGTEKPGYCVGFFSYPTLGEVWQVSDCSDNAVVIGTSGETHPVVVTPSDREGFMKALVAGTPSTFTPPGKRTSSWWFTLISLGVVLALVVLALVTVFFVAPARLRYTVRDGTLQVGTLFSQRQIPLAGARAYKHRPLLGARLSGLPLPGYNVGSWILDTMATTAYASARNDGVLLERDGRFFVNPSDPDGFLAALAEEGATVIADLKLQRRR
jgi:Bacterial PH domain